MPRPSSVPSQTLVAFFAGDDHFSSVSGASLQQPPRSRALLERPRRRTPGVGCQRPVLPAAYCSTSQLTMARTINSLMYKGSIPDAINQSRREKKLFVVYISGEDEALSNLEQSTLIDENVVEVIGRCCILLHLKQGNVDASQFSAIYPQKSVPSISVIGLNGVLLWNHEGYINSENLKESIEKAWAALHLQGTDIVGYTHFPQ